MTNPSLSGRASIAKLQRAAAKRYFALQQHFVGNNLVSETWGAMARDWIAQAESLKKLPSAFWLSLRDEEKKLARAAESQLSEFNGTDTPGLTASLALALSQEEPIVLTLYAPLIHCLRSNWTDLALDCYVLIRLHLSRLTRFIQAYAGDPALNQRCTQLLANFEKEVQKTDEIPAKASSKKTRKPLRSKRHQKAVLARHSLRTEKARPNSSRVRIAKHAKRIVKKLEMSRRRARR